METAVAEAVHLKPQSSVQQLERHQNTLLSPDNRNSLGRNAPHTPGCAVVAKPIKRPLSTEDDEPGQRCFLAPVSCHVATHILTLTWLTLPAEAAPSEADEDKPHPKPSRQYDKWSAEEEQIFFLKLPTVSSLELTEGLRCIAQHLPSKSSSQVLYFTMIPL